MTLFVGQKFSLLKVLSNLFRRQTTSIIMGSFNSYLDPHLKFLKMTSVYRDIYGMKGLSTVNLR